MSKYRTIENNEGTHILYNNYEIAIKPTCKDALDFIAAREEQRAEAAEARAAQLETERDTAWTELRVIRKAIGADDDEATSDEVSRLFSKLTAERDEANRTQVDEE